MHKGLKIILPCKVPKQFLISTLREKAHGLGIEGTAQIVSVDKTIKIIAFGQKECVDQFLDAIHDIFSEQQIYDIHVEPFIKRNDYRGVFRVIE